MRDAQRRRRFGHDDERDDDGQRGQEHQEKHGRRADQVVTNGQRDARLEGGVDALAQHLELRVGQDRRQSGRQRVANHEVRRGRVGSAADRRERRLAAGTLRKVRDQVHRTVDQTPGHVARDGRDQNASNLLAAGGRHRQRAGEGPYWRTTFDNRTTSAP